MTAKPQEARNSMVNLEFVSGEEAIQTLTDMFGADEVTRIARKHEQTIQPRFLSIPVGPNAPGVMGYTAKRSTPAKPFENERGEIIGYGWEHVA